MQHQYTINTESHYIPRPKLTVSTVAVAGFELKVVEDCYSRRFDWTLHESGRLIDSGHGNRHSTALALGTNVLLGCLRRAGCYPQAARIKRARA